MRQHLVLAALVLGLFAFATICSRSAGEETVRVATCNIKYPVEDIGGERLTNLKEVTGKLEADVIAACAPKALQEFVEMEDEVRATGGQADELAGWRRRGNAGPQRPSAIGTPRSVCTACGCSILRTRGRWESGCF